MLESKRANQTQKRAGGRGRQRQRQRQEKEQRERRTIKFGGLGDAVVVEEGGALEALGNGGADLVGAYG